MPPYPDDRCIPELLSEQARTRPDAVALAWGTDQLSYAALEVQADRLVQHPLARGVRPRDHVAVALDRSPELIVALLAVLKAGAAYVPLDPSYPAERLGFMLDDARVAAVLSRTTLAGFCPRSAARWWLDADATAIAACPAVPPAVAVTPDDLAYVMYTSGSTGRPKGVMVPHRGVRRLVLGTDYVRLEAGHRVVQGANASFDAAHFRVR